jgi:hypothetical protein
MLRPDPLIYSQYFLMHQGLAVTWDNPDIVVRKDGVTVPSHALEPATTYEIVARIWNASPSCPVVSMPVYFSYLSFGVGTTSTAIGKTHVDLGVRGGPGCPAFASVLWRTPSEPGHYCIQVRLAPADDLNMANNLGQENTTVGVAHSPAEFRFQLRNSTPVEQVFRFTTDAYTIPDPPPCEPPDSTGRTRAQRRDANGQVDFAQQGFRSRSAVNQARISRHALDNHPLPVGWRIDISPLAPDLAPDQEIPVQVMVHPPDGFRGSQAININAFAGSNLAGGVTLTVVGE